MTANPDRTIRFPLSWPASLQEQAAEAADHRHISLAAWLREAAEEKAERERKQRAPYLIRPGRYALVAPDLDALTGPAEGIVELPLNLYWSSRNRRFALADSGQLLAMYEAVLLEAATLDELTTLLNKGRLIEVWPRVYSKPVRRAWEDRHPVLREAAAKAAA